MLKSYFSDMIINQYPDIQTVKEAHAIEKGWIPALLPASAYNIKETHDNDSNQLFGSFYYKKEDEASILNALKPLTEQNDTYRWGAFYFKIDTTKQYVKFRNRPLTPSPLDTK